MMSLDHQLCIGNASKCLKHGIVQEKRKKTAACHRFHSSLLSIYVYSHVAVMILKRREVDCQNGPILSLLIFLDVLTVIMFTFCTLKPLILLMGLGASLPYLHELFEESITTISHV
jgi:hypothetical protein